MKDVIIYILGALTTVATQVVSYFFGSSTGSADKSKALNAMAKRGVRKNEKTSRLFRLSIIRGLTLAKVSTR